MTDQRRPADLLHDEVVDLAQSYVLGALDDDEMAAVRAHLASCTQPHPEIDELGGVLPILQAEVPLVEPPATLKERIMAAAAADLEARRRAEAQAAAAPVSPPSPPAAEAERPPVTTLRRRQPRWSWALGIAAVLAIALLGAWNLLLQSQLGAAQAYQRQVAAVLDAAGRPGALTAVMTTTDAGDGPFGLAAITSDGVMRIAMRDLDPTAGSEVYEAWVIVGDQAPVALGGFQVGAEGVGYLEADGLPTESGIVLALTREPRPGATAPSTTPVSVGRTTATG